VHTKAAHVNATTLENIPMVSFRPIDSLLEGMTK
jgi:hypothetical protein